MKQVIPGHSLCLSAPQRMLTIGRRLAILIYRPPFSDSRDRSCLRINIGIHSITFINHLCPPKGAHDGEASRPRAF